MEKLLTVMQGIIVILAGVVAGMSFMRAIFGQNEWALVGVLALCIACIWQMKLTKQL